MNSLLGRGKRPMGIGSLAAWNRFLEDSILTQTKKKTGNLIGGKSNALVSESPFRVI